MSAETVETVRQQGEDGIKGSIKPCLWAQKRMQKKKINYPYYNRLPENLSSSPEKLAEPQDAAMTQRNWLICHFKLMGKVDYTSIFRISEK